MVPTQPAICRYAAVLIDFVVLAMPPKPVRFRRGVACAHPGVELSSEIEGPKA
jgi:hypothetical protein